MACIEDPISVQDLHPRIQAVLVTQLKKLREQCPNHFSTPTHVLPAVDENAEDQLKQSLQRESRDHTGERIVLIPYHLDNSHWIGIMIKFQVHGQLAQVVYIDSLRDTSSVPNRVQSRFGQVYTDILIESRDLLKHDDPQYSAIFTIKNLLAAAGNISLLEKSSQVNDGNESESCELKPHLEEETETEMKIFWNEISNLDLDGFCPPNDYRVCELEEALHLGLRKFHFEDATILPREITETRERMKKLEQQKRNHVVEAEMKFLNELQELNELAELIFALRSVPQTPAIHPIEVNKKEVYLKTLRQDLDAIPVCAERTLIELILEFEGGTFSQQKDSVRVTLRDQLEREELLSETNRTILQNLDICISSNDRRSTICSLEELRRQIRSLNVPEICRLLAKSKDAAHLIRDKEIVLLLGETGAGKSTTVQFLAGSSMEATRIEIAPGKFIGHITVVGQMRNPQLNNVISSPFSKSETRHLTPVTIFLTDVFGAHETGVITLCDAPGFGDTAGAEMDIANSIGLVKALKGTKSVKILALSSYKSLGDRGQGIERLANILISMVGEIEDKLDSIVYAFTKYPQETNVNALLESLKTSRDDRMLITVLCDMITKTENTVYKIDPTHDDPKILLKKLRGIRGISYPEEVFRLSISEKTRASIIDQVQKDKFSIIRAMIRRDLELVSYYLNDLKILNDLIQEDVVRNTYEQSIHFVNDSIDQYCKKVMEEFNGALTGQKGLNEKDIVDYKVLVEYLAQAQKLKEYIGSSLLTPEKLIENIISQLQERHRVVENEELYSVLVKIYFNNLDMLKNSFEELEIYYSNSSKEFEKRFEDLVKSAEDPILSHDFTSVAEIFLKISKSLYNLKSYLGEKIEIRYRYIIQFLLRHLENLSKEAEIYLVKIRLNESDLEIVKKHIEILKSAKENSLLQKCVATDTNDTSKDLVNIYEVFLEKIVEYFDTITVRIVELLKTDNTHALEDVKKWVHDMATLREFPELKAKTAQKYYQTAQNIHTYLHQLQTNVEQLLVSLQQQQQTVNYKLLARLVSQLQTADWTNDILPGTYDAIMHRLTDEFVEYAQQLETALKKLDLSLKCPDNIGVALRIAEKMEDLKILEHSISELEKYRIQMSEHFRQCVQKVLDWISTIQAEEKKMMKLDASTTNSALIYLAQCEKVNRYNIRESAIQIRENLHQYLSEYGRFLTQEISRTFEHTCRIGEDLSQCSQELDTHLKKLSSLSKFSHVFSCLEGPEKVEYWLREFLHYYRTVSANLEEYKSFHKNKELRDQLIVVQALSGVDRFCVTIFHDHGFGSLYRAYQIEMARAAKEACKVVLDCLSKDDYAKADIVLHNIDKDLLNAKDLVHIKHDLDSSLNQLMKKTNSSVLWLDGKPEREKENQDRIMEIKESVDKIRIALNKPNIVDLLSDEIRAHLQNFDNEINEMLSDILLKGFSAIEVYINTEHFLEADQALENLSRIQRDLTGYCTSLHVMEKSEELRKRLDSTVNDSLEREKFANIDNYSIQPPKELLDRFQMLAKHGNVKYNQVYSSMLAIIKQHFNLAIEKARVAPLEERKEKISSLNRALYFLSDDLQIYFKLPMEDLNKLIGKLSEQKLRELREYHANVQHCLDRQQTQSAMDIMRKIVEQKEAAGVYFPEIEEVCRKVHQLIMNDISSIEPTHSVEDAFSRLIIYLEFSDVLDKKICENAREKLQKIFAYFVVNAKQFQTALSEMNLVELRRIMMISKKWDELNKKSMSVFSEEMTVVISFTEMTSELEKSVHQLVSTLDQELFVDGKIPSEEELHENSIKIINIIKGSTSECKDILPLTLNVEKLEERLKKKIEECANQLVNSASTTDLLTRDIDYFRSCYDYLSLFEGMNIRDFLQAFKEKVFKRISLLCEQETDVADLLIKLRYFGEKLSIFEYQTDSEIDKILHGIKEQKDLGRIRRLIMALDRSDIGRRLIDAHHSLNVNDCRNRWEKMQNQHNLVYVLENLEGDQIDQSILATHYHSFEQIYKNITASFLSSLDSMEEIDRHLVELSSNIKAMAGLLVQTSTADTWDNRLIDGIIQLIAHLFALWTLTNTHCYTATCPYLFTPHVAQVIAVFRLLGLDSSVHLPVKGSNLLSNHLVEIGTGEGKSVVIAITACIFALIGVDVSCSCYSEDLSMRDRNAFNPIFRALDLEERITYSTFHGMCEQLVNEQCDIREKVRDMIVNNKTILAVDRVKYRTRRKVLLIDEVDVFLSDKFYGGLYTPAVIIKSDSIKMLFDTIWQNKTSRSLDNVQDLPAYQACAKNYGHWSFLLKNALKEMLAALELFQSSTYFVQNDKIVHADNALCGYNTMWAYYHESEKGTISRSSLESNVGIIINCGSFSYAELFHDFVYIAGLTGTLKTLVQSEKDILRRVYAIHRSTYIPSMFGKSNRSFNPATDVHVVGESEYLTRIRAEIDNMCQANRAILVFFESEEKLMAFYCSTAIFSMKQKVQIITERVPLKERERCIERATMMGRVTLLTRVFGRGLDFICRDPQLLVNGGIHILQTFFSEASSEEYQIMGRGARQGQSGSYQMILLDKDLEWVLGSTWKEELSQIPAMNLYETLDKARYSHHETRCVAKQRNTEEYRIEHRNSVDFLFALRTGEMGTIKRFLSEQTSAPIRFQFSS